MYEPSDPPIHPFSCERQSTSVISYPSPLNQAVAHSADHPILLIKPFRGLSDSSALGNRGKTLLSGTAATSFEVACSFLLPLSAARQVSRRAVVVENFLSVSALGQSSSVQALIC